MDFDFQHPSAVVGDVGGTNARFAVADLSHPDRPQICELQHLPSADYDSLEAALGAYLKRLAPSPMPPLAVIAVAGPVNEGEAVLTNLSWHASETALRKLGFAQTSLINDFRALAASADSLMEDELELIGPSLPRLENETVAIVGAGTGFGSSALVREPGKAIALAGEGGHIGFSPEGDEETEILRVVAQRFGRVSIERLVSGPGLVNLYSALCTIDGVSAEFDEPPKIVAAAEKGEGLARRAVERFCALFGAAAGDIALTFGARGGVLIAGGLSEAMTRFLKAGHFRDRFEGKGRLAHVVQEIPTHMITRPDAALLGGARLAQTLRAAGK